MAHSDKLNRYVVTRHFKMESIRTAKRLIQMGDWLVKLDLKDAYFTVSIHLSHQKISQALVAGPDVGIQSRTVWCSIHLFDSSVHTEEAGIQIDLLLRQYADIGKISSGGSRKTLSHSNGATSGSRVYNQPELEFHGFLLNSHNMTIAKF